MSTRFELIATEDLTIEAPPALGDAQLMSPFVWLVSGGGYEMLLRVVPCGERTASGLIWRGRSPDGLRFRLDDEALISPGPDPIDALGCEDPTLVPDGDGCLVYYTGVDEEDFARLLYATGPDLDRLEKQGVAFGCPITERYTKEAVVHRTPDGDWRLYFEYAHDGRSRIGVALRTGPHKEWEQQGDPFTTRADRWDSWHLSTGPLLTTAGYDPLMFYNGADADARWGIGWATFRRDCMTVQDRSEHPLIAPPGDAEGDGRDIAFASSAIEADGVIHLYFSHDDRTPRRATVRRL